jgi:hypothetical protein
MSSWILVWLTLGFGGALLLVLLLFWIAGRYFRDD